MRRRVALLSAVAVAALAGATIFVAGSGKGVDVNRADVVNVEQVALGSAIYASHCAACHGANLEGQPDWRKRKPDGRLPAPPHDKTGHTWEHPDDVLFRVTKEGFQTFAGASYQTDMPAFKATLSDKEIWAVLAFIKSRWPPHLLKRQQMHEATTYVRQHEQHTAKPAARGVDR